ncbi:hypothetical protein AYI68_g223 [Smittium mucronatum]|uniref:Asparaginase n=1 Tax=Smittium mucronatum TaxID=133383 RepID=A0A1R0H8U2_9FUNG|nr:hypothetical protein AYI68_g223 [Smittium mucronatum]
MSEQNTIINEATAFRSLAESSNGNTNIGLAKVLIIYTGGTIGMVNSPLNGYTPVSGYLTEYLKTQSRFHDPEALENILAQDSNSPEFSKNSFGSGRVYLNSSLFSDLNEHAGDVEENLSDWLVTPKVINNKRIK